MNIDSSDLFVAVDWTRSCNGRISPNIANSDNRSLIKIERTSVRVMML